MSLADDITNLQLMRDNLIAQINSLILTPVPTISTVNSSNPNAPSYEEKGPTGSQSVDWNGRLIAASEISDAVSTRLKELREMLDDVNRQLQRLQPYQFQSRLR